MDDDDDGNGNEDAYVGIVEPSFSQMVILIVVMVRKRIGQMGISSSLGMCRRRSGGKGERREVLEWMLMRLAYGEGDKDKKSQARVWMSQCLCCKGPQSVYILSCRRYLYPWDLLLLLRLLPRLQGVPSGATNKKSEFIGDINKYNVL